MGKSRELNEFERGKIIGLRIAGRTHEAIARLLRFQRALLQIQSPDMLILIMDQMLKEPEDHPP